MTFPADEVIRPAPQLWTTRTHPIRMVEVHSTRGGSQNEYTATKNWMQSSGNNQGGWGGSCSYIIAPSGRICRVLDDDQMPTYGAGYGGAGSTYAIDEYAVAVEWCQATIDTPFTEAQYAAGADLYAYYCKAYDIPPVMLTIPRQTGDPPTGFVRHDRCENGAKLGKSDPGPQFNEAKFIAAVKARLEATVTLNVRLIKKASRPEVFADFGEYLAHVPDAKYIPDTGKVETLSDNDAAFRKPAAMRDAP